MKVNVRAAKLFAALTFFLFVAFNIPGRLVVDGTTKSWFAVSVPGPERFADKIPWMKPARLNRGWPWVFRMSAIWIACNFVLLFLWYREPSGRTGVSEAEMDAERDAATTRCVWLALWARLPR